MWGISGVWGIQGSEGISGVWGDFRGLKRFQRDFRGLGGFQESGEIRQARGIYTKYIQIFRSGDLNNFLQHSTH